MFLFILERQEGRRGGGWWGETLVNCLLPAQARHLGMSPNRPGIKLVTFGYTGQHPTHLATPARASTYFFICKVFIENLLHSC